MITGGRCGLLFFSAFGRALARRTHCPIGQTAATPGSGRMAPCPAGNSAHRRLPRLTAYQDSPPAVRLRVSRPIFPQHPDHDRRRLSARQLTPLLCAPDSEILGVSSFRSSSRLLLSGLAGERLSARSAHSAAAAPSREKSLAFPSIARNRSKSSIRAAGQPLWIQRAGRPGRRTPLPAG